MLKKLALAIAIVVTSSFATWDKFPVLEASKGQTEVGYSYASVDKINQLDFRMGVRYSFVQNFEFGITVPYLIFIRANSEDQNRNGFMDISLLTRYQIFPVMNIFFDFSPPTCSSELCGDNPAFFNFGTQYSQSFGFLQIGSEISLTLQTEGNNHVTPPWNMDFGIEARFNFSGTFVPYIGIDMTMLLGKNTANGENFGESYTGKMGYAPYLGGIVNIDPIVYLGFKVQLEYGEVYYENKDKTPLILTLNFGINFRTN